MNPRTKIFFVEADCGKLINLLLWFEQFPEFEVVGSISQAEQLNWPLHSSRADVVLVDLTEQSAQSLAILRAYRNNTGSPAVAVITKPDQSAIEKAIATDAECTIKASASVKELAETLRRSLQKRRTVATVNKLPLTKAG